MRALSHDPLHQYLQYEILPRMGQPSNPARFRVFHLRGSNEVYLYEEQHSRVRIVGKFFAGHGASNDEGCPARGHESDLFPF
jgi:hypothetical protein